MRSSCDTPEMESSNVISEDEGQRLGFGTYSVTVIPHCYLGLASGVKIAARIWFPALELPTERFRGLSSYQIYQPKHPAIDSKYPAIVESHPYRKSDYTASRDHQKYTWFCSHGFVCVRVDTRGTGDSEGLCLDEYTPEEIGDACHTVQWLSEQTWSNGRVGMYGESWSGFLSLQTAACQAPALKTIISGYASDDRYANDCHYMGGCVIGSEMLPWSGRMLCWNATPPHPGYVSDWKGVWKQRLEKATTSFATKWLQHQHRDDYWKQGSINKDYPSVTCPVLMIGGWCDAYSDGVLRIVQNVPNARSIIGPWCHEWPASATPGPQIDYLSECLKWWSYHLKGVDNGVMDVARLRVYVRDALEPNVNISHWPGKWLKIHNLSELNAGPKMTLFPAERGMLLEQSGTVSRSLDLNFIAGHGLRAGGWLRFGFGDHPADQRVEDGLSDHWDTPELYKNICLLGSAVLHCALSTCNHTGVIAARLCHVWPNGESTLISYGLLNLCHSDGHTNETVKEIRPGELLSTYMLRFVSTSYTVPKGHKIRLAVATNFWPRMWPATHSSPVKLYFGTDEVTYLTLPVLHVDELSQSGKLTDSGMENLHSEAKTGHQFPVRMESEFKFDRSSSYDFISGVHKLTISINGAKMVIPDYCTLSSTTTVQETLTNTFRITDGDPLSAKVTSENIVSLEYTAPHKMEIQIISTSEMWSTETTFNLSNDVKVYLEKELWFSKSWRDEVERSLV